MDWTQVITIVGSNIALFLWARQRARSDTRMMLRMIDRIQLEEKLDKKNDKQFDRSDILYEMFIDLLKEQKK